MAELMADMAEAINVAPRRNQGTVRSAQFHEWRSKKSVARSAHTRSTLDRTDEVPVFSH